MGSGLRNREPENVLVLHCRGNVMPNKTVCGTYGPLRRTCNKFIIKSILGSKISFVFENRMLFK